MKSPEKSQTIANHCIPLITNRGLALLALTTLAPLAGILANAALADVLLLSVTIYLIWLGIVLLEEFKLYRLAKRIACSLTAESQLYAMAGSVLQLKITHPVREKTYPLEFRFNSPLEIHFVQQSFKSALVAESSETQINCAFLPVTRGVVTWECLWVRLSSPNNLAMLQFRLKLAAPVSVAIYPNPSLYRLSPGKAVSARLPGGVRVEQSGGEGREFDRLRKYSSGDDLRRVDWKRSSTRNSLLVKVYRPETLQRIAILLDCSRRMNNLVENRLLLDFAVDAAASVLDSASQNADQVGLFTFDHRNLREIPIAHGKQHRQLILDCLRDAKPGTLEADYDLVRTWALRAQRRSLIILITSLSTPTGVENIRQALLPVRQKHLPLVAAINDRDLIELLNSPAESLEAAMTVAAGWQQMQSIQSRINLLKRSGIDCVYGDAAKLPQLTTIRYQQLKALGRL